MMGLSQKSYIKMRSYFVKGKQKFQKLESLLTN